MNVRRIATFAALAVASLGAGPTRAGIIEDFQFNDSNGTVITAAANSANPGNQWLSQNTDVQSAALDGAFRIQKETVTGQVGNTLDIANATSGKIWLVAKIAGWSYTDTPSSPSERVRFAFLDNDPPAAGSSVITAQMNIDRHPDNSSLLTISGDAGGTGATGTIAGGPLLPLTRNSPLTMVLEVDTDADTYTIMYRDGAAPFVTLGTGNLGERSAGVMREARSVRFAFTGTYIAGDGEFVDVDRIFVSTSPIPEPCTLVLAGLAGALLLAPRRRS